MTLEPNPFANSARVLRLPENRLGRDFAVGDIHGAFELVGRAMEAVRFDPACDRLFTTGDLIDRGEQSYRCVEFLSLPFVFSTRGNHEQMLLDLYADGKPSQETLQRAARQFGTGWWLELMESQRQEVLDAIARLPVAIEVVTARGKAGFVHADIPADMHWEEFLARIEAGEYSAIDAALWGRSRVHNKQNAIVEGVGRVFVGHNIQWDGLRRYGNVYALDTGAIFGHDGTHPQGRLTMVDVVARTDTILAERPFANVDVRIDSINGGAGSGTYACAFS